MGLTCISFFLIVMGVFSKFAAALVAIPSPVLGGMTSKCTSKKSLQMLTQLAFLFCAVAVAGMAIISRAGYSRRNRFILTASLAVGFGAILVPNWFSFVFTYKGNNHALEGFFNAIVLVMETGFAVTALLAMLLNLLIGEEVELNERMLEGHQVPAPVEDVDKRSSGDDEIEVEKRREPSVGVSSV